MRLQLLSDLHLETEAFDPEPAPGAELLVLAGDIDRGWHGFERFAGWPVPVLVVAGNHEFDGRELDTAWPALRERCDTHGLRLLEREACVIVDRDGRSIRVLGCTRWCDFDLFGPARRVRCQRAARYYVEVMRATRSGRPFDPPSVREEALLARDWLHETLAAPDGSDRTVVVTHYAPSARSSDPRYGLQSSTASFCNADDALLPGADLWIHGHLHCRNDYVVHHADDVGRAATRVVANPRGHGKKGEPAGFDGLFCVEV